MGCFKTSNILTGCTRLQIRAKTVADGKSAVAGVHAYGDRWQVKTPHRWGVKQRHLAYVNTREEAELIAATYSPRLKAAAATGGTSFEEELSAVKAELRVQVRLWIVP